MDKLAEGERILRTVANKRKFDILSAIVDYGVDNYVDLSRHLMKLGYRPGRVCLDKLPELVKDLADIGVITRYRSRIGVKTRFVVTDENKQRIEQIARISNELAQGLIF